MVFSCASSWCQGPEMVNEAFRIDRGLRSCSLIVGNGIQLSFKLMPRHNEAFRIECFSTGRLRSCFLIVELWVDVRILKLFTKHYESSVFKLGVHFQVSLHGKWISRELWIDACSLQIFTDEPKCNTVAGVGIFPTDTRINGKSFSAYKRVSKSQKALAL